MQPNQHRDSAKIDAAEQMIVDALPEIIGKLVSMAKDGVIPAARYLVDRILGRVRRLPAPPTANLIETASAKPAYVNPFSQPGFSFDDLLTEERRNSNRARIPSAGAAMKLKVCPSP